MSTLIRKQAGLFRGIATIAFILGAIALFVVTVAAAVA